MSDAVTAAHCLVGLELDDGWQVLSRVDLAHDHTGGAFSVGYLARHPGSGTMGYLKGV
jgi:hypothetical protein